MKIVAVSQMCNKVLKLERKCILNMAEIQITTKKVHLLRIQLMLLETRNVHPNCREHSIQLC